MTYVNVISNKPSPRLQYLTDLARYRHLCWNLVGSDLRSRFRRSRLGFLWAIIQPLSFALMLAFVYGQLFGQADFWTFAVYVFSGMILWEYFSNCANLGVDSLINAQGYLRQARIPFIVFQMRVPLTNMVIYLAGLTGLIALMVVTQRLPPIGPQTLLILPVLPMMVVFGTGICVLFSILGTQFRDVKYVTGITFQALFFVSPVFLDRSFMASDKMQIIGLLNPFAALAELARAPLVYGEYWNPQTLIIFGAWTVVIWVAAIVLAATFGRKLVYAL